VRVAGEFDPDNRGRVGTALDIIPSCGCEASLVAFLEVSRD
jgi:hypothetical protein